MTNWSLESTLGEIWKQLRGAEDNVQKEENMKIIRQQYFNIYIYYVC